MTPSSAEAPAEERCAAVLSAGPRGDDAASAVSAALGRPLLDGHAIDVLRNGDEIFPAMLDAIENARTDVDLVTFVWWEGAVAQRFAETLAAKARTGARVRVLVDAFGGHRMEASAREAMESGGVQVREFRPPRKRDLLRLTNRTHRKVLVCDRRVAFTGGVGIAEEWSGAARNPDEWRETHFRVRGPAVAELHTAFRENWHEAAGWCEELLSGEADAVGSVRALAVRSNGGAGWSDVRTALHALLDAARESITITTAYFVPDPSLQKLMEGALDRGVEVRVLLPGRHTDARLCNLAGAEEMHRLAERGARVHLYQRTMLHAKITIVDGRVSMIGSANFNARSLDCDDEVALIVDDASFAAELLDDFERDLDGAEAFDPTRYSKRNAFQSAREWLARRLRRSL